MYFQVHILFLVKYQEYAILLVEKSRAVSVCQIAHYCCYIIQNNEAKRFSNGCSVAILVY